MGKSVAAIVFVLALSLSVSSAFAGVIYTSGTGDGTTTKDWYSGAYYWVDTTGATVSSYHDGGNRWLNRGAVIFDISSLAGVTLPANIATFNFYSFGFSGVTLQYSGNTGAEVTTGYANATGANIASLAIGEGWQSFDVTSLLQSSINSSAQHVAFIFNATSNYGGGSLAASEDPSGRGAYLANVPEPATLSLLGLGLAGLIARRKRK